jgi:hypothetical protein
MLKFIIKALAASAGALTICYVVDLKKKNKEISEAFKEYAFSQYQLSVRVVDPNKKMLCKACNNYINGLCQGLYKNTKYTCEEVYENSYLRKVN